MATTKKTPATKKPVAKKAAVAPKPRSDYKPGTRVKVTLKNGTTVASRVMSVMKTATGPFVVCNIGTTQLPRAYAARPAKVKGF